MKFNLNPLKKYKKRNANLRNSYKRFLPRKDKIVIDLSLFDADMPPSVYFADSKKDYRKSQKTTAPFIYFRKKGFLLFNQNGDGAKLGKGGIAALFPKNQKLRKSSFKFVNNFSDNEPAPTPEPTPEPTPAPPPIIFKPPVE